MDLKVLGQEKSWWCFRDAALQHGWSDIPFSASGLAVALGLEVMSYRAENPEHQAVRVLIKPASSPRLLFFMAVNSLSG